MQFRMDRHDRTVYSVESAGYTLHSSIKTSLNLRLRMKEHAQAPKVWGYGMGEGSIGEGH